MAERLSEQLAAQLDRQALRDLTPRQRLSLVADPFSDLFVEVWPSLDDEAKATLQVLHDVDGIEVDGGNVSPEMRRDVALALFQLGARMVAS